MSEELKIVICKTCGAKNRIKSHSTNLRPICGKCGNSLVYSEFFSGFKLILSNFFFIIVIAGIVYGITKTPKLLKKDFSELKLAEEKETEKLKELNNKKLTEIESQLKEDVAKINPTLLREYATEYYHKIFEARESYDKRYALTPREKTQLKMKELASDSAQSYREAIKSIALEASPKGADVNVNESVQGITLLIDFDMSSMTSGEHGTSTKHDTKESLKKEVITLISRVTNDIFQFCKDFELDNIYVGCRHYVITEYPDGSTHDENTILYKICIRKKNMPKLMNNPFLDFYSTKQYFEVEEDNFEDIELVSK